MIGASRAGSRRLGWLAGSALLLALAGGALEDAGAFDRLRFAIQRDPSWLPSSRGVAPREVVHGLPLLSIYLPPEDLADLLHNKLEHGRKWERQASISYFDGGQLRFASQAGVRIHGGGSRITSDRQGFRVFFRWQYGATEVSPRVLFGGRADPLQRLVVHNDVRTDERGQRWHLVNPLAYDLARRIGCITPETQPARFFLNGEDQGLFVLTEHFDDEYFQSHLPGHRVTMELADMEQLRDALESMGPLTVDRVSDLMSMDNVTSWFLATVFTASGDAYQGPGQFLDESRDRGGWFWVTWDLDQSFRSWDVDSFEYLLERVEERPKGRRASEPRSFVISGLLAEDPAFREYLAQRVDDMLNHQLTRAFVEERRAHYADLAARFGVADHEYLAREKEFFEKRPAVVRATAEQWLNRASSLPVSVRRDDGGPLSIDGFPESGDYRGSYFTGREIILRMPAGEARWVVNGTVLSSGAELRQRVDRPLTIVAVVGAGEIVPAPEPPPEVRTVPPAAPPPAVALEWRRIQGRPFEMGCTLGDTHCEPNELPRHTVNPGTYSLAATETTVDQFARFARATGAVVPRQPRWSDAGHPIVNVTWSEAAAFCDWAGGRLPTEAEWEFAARGGPLAPAAPGQVDRATVNGTGVVASDLWRNTAPARSLPPNVFGVHELIGNVWEWTSDWYREGESWGASPQTVPPTAGQYLKTIRGGSWDSTSLQLRISKRAGLSVKARQNLYVGFRCAR